MNDLMEVRRQAFEFEHRKEAERLVAQYGQRPELDIDYTKKETGLYVSGLVQAAWWGYNAALDSVVVEPK